MHVILELEPEPTSTSVAFGAPAGRRTRLTGKKSRPRESLRVRVDELAGNDFDNLSRNKQVKAVAPVVPMRLIRPVDTGAAKRSIVGRTAWGVKAVGAVESKFTGKGITVAVLDTGVDSKHPAFAGVKVTAKNFTEDPIDDQEGHGTHCAGTIFGRDVGGTRIGVARGVTRALNGKVIGKKGAGSDRIVSAIQWAVEEDATIISMSLGIDFPGLVKRWEEGAGMPTELAVSRALEGYRANVLLFERLAAYLRSRDDFGRTVLLVAAAGNESRRARDPNFVIGVSPPAVSDGVVSVAALGPGPGGLAVADFSNVGAHVSGPGVDIVSAKAGTKELTPDSGTSMATPHVAGVAALWAEFLQQNGGLSHDLLKERVLGSATMKGLASTVMWDVGRGLVQAP